MKGGERGVEVELVGGSGGEGVKPSVFFSISRIVRREEALSQAGGRMLARRCRLRRRASQRGISALWGGIRGLVGPYRGWLVVW